MRMGQNGGTSPRGPRCVELVGPFQSGKTTLLEAMLARTGAIQRQGTVEAGTAVGDGGAESRHHKMSVELSVATTNFLGDNYTFIDCPGSVEFVHDMRAVLPGVDAAVVVCEADERKVPQLQLVLRELEDLRIPRFLFLNKIDKADKRVRETLKILQPASRVPLVLRQIPIWSNDIITGFVDLALERAFIYKEHAASEVVALDEHLDREKEARFSMLEKLADHDDELMEQLLEDIPPPRDKVFDDLAKELRDGIICPVLIGSATRTNGVLRLLKALRHEAPAIADTVKRLGVAAKGDAIAYVMKTLHTTHGGKMSIARVLAGSIGEGAMLMGSSGTADRVSGVFKLTGQTSEKRGTAGQGEMHLRVATERLAGRFGVASTSRRPTVGYRETIRKGIVQRGRHKKQSGGHGQFGDVVLDIKPLPRGSGFSFDEEITGGVVPRNYIPSVEEGVIDGLKTGPLGFPVVDVAVTLIDGSYHTVDSSDQASRTAGRIGIVEALPQSHPVLLEPIYTVEIVCPSEATAKINAILSGRRGQILGFDTREGWPGWDTVRALMPESEIGDLIVEIRSATAGVGSFSFKFDHMAELTGKQADQIVAARRAAE